MPNDFLPPESTPAAATSDVDFDAMTDDQRSYVINSGGELPPDFVKAAAAPVEKPVENAAEPVENEEKAEGEEAPAAEPEPEKEAEAEKEEAEVAEPDELEAKVAAFKFTDGADAETRAKEEAEYLELVELPEQVQQMIAARDAELVELRGRTVETDQSTHQHMEAFDKLVNFTRDEDGDIVPDTSGVRSLLETVYKNEKQQVIKDLLRETSPKYPHLTRYQEFMRDAFDVSDESMKTIETFLHNGGKFPAPQFVPDGIDPRVGEAYWRNPKRDEIDAELSRLAYTLSDERATDDEVRDAKKALRDLNGNLALVQRGINADLSQKQNEIDTQNNFRNEVLQAGNRAFFDTGVGLLQQAKKELAASFTMFDKAGAEATASAYATTINNALSGVDGFDKVVQQELAAVGIKVDWVKAETTVKSLLEVERTLAGLQRVDGINPRAIENAQKEKNKILLEFKGLEKNLIGQITRVVAKGAGAALETKVQTAQKIAVGRPKVKGAASANGGRVDFNAMPLDQLRRIRDGREAVPTG